MKIAVAKETLPLESRVAIVPDAVKKYVGLDAEVRVERGAGLALEAGGVAARPGVAREVGAGAGDIGACGGTAASLGEGC